MLLTENLSHLSDSPHLVVLVRVIFANKAVISWMEKGAEVFEAAKLDELVGGGGEAIEIVLLAVLRVTMQFEFMLMIDKVPGRTLLLILTLLGKEELL